MTALHSFAAHIAALQILALGVPAAAYVGPTLNPAGATYVECVLPRLARSPAMQAALLEQLHGAQIATSPAWQSPTWHRQYVLVAELCGRAPTIAMWDFEGADVPAFPDAVRTAELMMLFSEQVARIEQQFIWLPAKSLALQVGTE